MTFGNNVVFIPFVKARSIVRKLGLTRRQEFEEWSKSGQRPRNIPSNPNQAYAEEGWVSWPDWMGYQERYPGRGNMLPFNKARKIARTFGLNGREDWLAWCKSGKRPPNVPSNPWEVYKEKGWVSLADWMGYKVKRGQVRGQMLPFKKARSIVRKLGLKSNMEWRGWSKSEKRPFNIPSTPDQQYRDSGWVSWPDWLKDPLSSAATAKGRGTAAAAAAARKPASKKAGGKRKRSRPTAAAAAAAVDEEEQEAAEALVGAGGNGVSRMAVSEAAQILAGVATGMEAKRARVRRGVK